MAEEIKNSMYDMIIIGGGPSGYSGAIYAARYGMKVLVIAKERGGLVTKTHLIENWPGEKSISGFELMMKMEDHVRDYDVDIIDDEITEISKKDDMFNLKAQSGKEFIGRSVLLATGTKRRELNAPGEKEYYGKGVSYCATCDGPLYRGKTVGVVGGSDSAAKEALFLSEHAEKVYIIYRKEKIRAEPINAKRVEANDKIEIINNANVKSIEGDGKFLTHVILDREYNGSERLELQGLFIEIGHIAQNELAKQLDVELNDKGEIIIDKYSQTNIEGVYAAGDIVNLDFKQAITGAGQATIATYSAFNYIQKIKSGKE